MIALNIYIRSRLSAGTLKYEHLFFLGQIFQWDRKIFLSIEGKDLDCLTRKADNIHLFYRFRGYNTESLARPVDFDGQFRCDTSTFV